jgi:hypothetical protein
LKGDIMKQQVNITLTLTLWIDARKDRNGITALTHKSLQRGFGERFASMHVIDVKEEAEIYGNDQPMPRPPENVVHEVLRNNNALLHMLWDLLADDHEEVRDDIDAQLAANCSILNQP